jgi:hypothetical protein
VRRSRHPVRASAHRNLPFATYEDLGPFEQRVVERLSVIRRETGREPTAAEEKKAKREESRRQRRAVAGFDLVFTPVKCGQCAHSAALQH